MKSWWTRARLAAALIAAAGLIGCSGGGGARPAAVSAGKTSPTAVAAAPFTPAATSTIPSPTAATAPKGDLRYWADRLVSEVAPDHNTYAAHPTTVTWASVDGARETQNRSVCSTLVATLIERADGYSEDDLVGWFGSTSPTAADFYAAVTSVRGFAPVKAIGSIVPGDIIVVQYPPGSHPTGHVMLVDGPPERLSPTAPRVAGTEQWVVPIIDSSTSGHGPSDTRALPNGKFHVGVGRGTLRLYSGAGGEIVGYSWSPLSISKFISRQDRPIVVGRVDGSLRPGLGRQGRTNVDHETDDVESGDPLNGP